MSYIIKISNQLKHFKRNSNDITHLAIKQPQCASSGREIALYKDGKDYNGIYALGVIMGKPLKISEIPKEEQQLIYDRSLLQLPVLITQYTVYSYLDKKYVNHLPSLNQGEKVRTYNFDKIYWTWGLSVDLENIMEKKWWYFSYLAAPTENHFKYWFHLIREKRFSRGYFKQYKNILKNKNSCSICGMKATKYKEFYHDFLELHETIKIEFDEEYKQIEKSNFIVVCPNCHKLEHEKIKNE